MIFLAYLQKHEITENDISEIIKSYEKMYLLLFLAFAPSVRAFVFALTAAARPINIEKLCILGLHKIPLKLELNGNNMSNSKNRLNNKNIIF